MKKVKNIVLVVFSIVFIAYLLMVFDTNSLMREVRDAFHWRIDRSETVGKPLHSFNMNREHETLGKSRLFLIRLLVIHNFREGWIWAHYTYQSFNEEGQLITGSVCIPTKWRIEKIDGKWEIIDIFEAP